MIAPLGVGMVGFGVSLGAQFVGTDLSTAVNGALVTSASPAFILLFAALILREKLSVRRIASVALATAGVLVIVDPRRADFSSQTFMGDVSLALAALTWGLYSVLVRRFTAHDSPSPPVERRLGGEAKNGDSPPDTLTLTLLAFLGGLIVILPASAIELASRPIGPLTGGVILGVLYLGIISTAVAMWLWNRAFALVSASAAALFFFAQPVVGAGLGVLLLGQPMTPGLWIGAALIAAGVLLAALSPSA